ncbi:hypothetical protein K503DRAFT_143684 [Rhizopogon vinicolor AM-OR11-026]|uniref:Uncharacterized protein n=1 Tax=Rhizopogon vinicolor AM-OR11-026 TaxID=1314800 RepID=A0A1B7MEE1_9AGAM|nr:hypothetical protein K503DRAFT_143684 [Rhizopogon vinicolor AM-OR11-026]
MQLADVLYCFLLPDKSRKYNLRCLRLNALQWTTPDACCPPSPDTSRMMMKVSLRVCLDLNSQSANQFQIWSTIESTMEPRLPSLNASVISLIMTTKISHQLRNLAAALFTLY